MGFFDLILGNFSPSPKIYRSAIMNIPGARFSRQIVVTVNGKQAVLVGQRLRDWLASLAGGGVTKTSLEKRLIAAGLKDGQYARRQEIIDILWPKKKTEDKKQTEKEDKERAKEKEKLEKEYEIKY